MANSLTKHDVLEAMPRSAAMWTGYIVDQLRRDHKAHVAAGGKGHAPRSSIVLSRLRALEADGLIRCTGGPNGYYGFTWEITPAGAAAIAARRLGSIAQPASPSQEADCG